MKDLTNPPKPGARAPRMIRGIERDARHQHKLVAPTDTAADIYSHLRWVGPGTFLVAAYIHKRMGH
jgi:hypothetical protein